MGLRGIVGYSLVKFVYSGYIARADKGTVARVASQLSSSSCDIEITRAVGSCSVLFEEIEFC